METNFWRVSAGEQGKYWEEFLREEKIKIGWQKLPDASHILTANDCKNFVKEHNETLHGVFFSFLKEIQHGDIVFVSKGLTNVRGIGEVISDYGYDELSNYKHFRRVKWLSTTIIADVLNPLVGSFKKILADELAKILGNEQINAILSSHKSTSTRFDLFTDFPLETYEGYQREQFVKHIIRERDKKLIKNYKEKYKSIQICPACNFNPQLIYDVKAIDLFEVHHVVPIGSRNEQTGYKTLEKDLILLCPNCHKFIHQLMINASPESVTLSMLKASLKS
jgi:hypothetical protein